MTPNGTLKTDFTISLERRVWFFFISGGHLIVGALQVQGIWNEKSYKPDHLFSEESRHWGRWICGSSGCNPPRVSFVGRSLVTIRSWGFQGNVLSSLTPSSCIISISNCTNFSSFPSLRGLVAIGLQSGVRLENRNLMSTEADETLQEEELEIRRFFLVPPKAKGSSDCWLIKSWPRITQKVLCWDRIPKEGWFLLSFYCGISDDKATDTFPIVESTFSWRKCRK